MSAATRLQRTAAKPQSTSQSPSAGLLLQRKCACGGSPGLTGECEECRRKRLQTKLTIGASNDPLEQEADRVADQVLATPPNSAVSGAPPRIQRFTGQSIAGTDTAPASVDRVLAGSGRPFDPALQQNMGQRFGQDFSRVRVHTGSAAEQSAREVNANAYTVGHDIVFGTGRFAPGSHEGRRLLAHELTHVVQQSGGGGIRTGQSNQKRGLSPVTTAIKLQRQVPENDERRLRLPEARPSRFQLQEPVLGQSLGFRPARLGLDLPQLRLDPQIEAQIRAIQFMRGLISIENIIQSAEPLNGLSMTSPVTPAGSPSLVPSATQPSPTQSGASLGLNLTPPRQPAPLVPRGAGPETPRTANMGDLLKALLQIPAVQSGVNALQTEAERQLRTSWNSLSTGERVLVITHGIVLGGGALAGVLSNPESRRFLLDQVQGRTIPIPGLPLTFQFNLTGPDQRIQIGLDVGALLPPQLGFGRRD